MSHIKNNKTEIEILHRCPHCNKSSMQDDGCLITVNDGGSIQCGKCKQYWHYCTKKANRNSPCAINQCEVKCTSYSVIPETNKDEEEDL
jgi:hypothetical protein